MACADIADENECDNSSLGCEYDSDASACAVAAATEPTTNDLDASCAALAESGVPCAPGTGVFCKEDGGACVYDADAAAAAAAEITGDAETTGDDDTASDTFAICQQGSAYCVHLTGDVPEAVATAWPSTGSDECPEGWVKTSGASAFGLQVASLAFIGSLLIK